MRRFRMLVVVVYLVTAVGPAPSPPSPSGTTGCDLPVDAVVVEGFRPPAQPWLPGNRGLTFATVAGQPARAVAEGTVVFAGPVAGAWYVTVTLADGRDVTSSYLSAVAVTAGDTVDVGTVVGWTGQVPFQLGYRYQGAYLDPTGLVQAACGWTHAVLVPVPVAAGRARFLVPADPV